MQVLRPAIAPNKHELQPKRASCMAWWMVGGQPRGVNPFSFAAAGTHSARGPPPLGEESGEEAMTSY